MEMMNELLEKYFRGETTLVEEAELKKYFASQDVNIEHEIYRALFVVFDQEKNETAKAPLKKVMVSQNRVKQLWIRTFSYSGIAAALILALWIQRPKQNDDYAVIHGRRIDSPEYAQQYAEKKLNSVNEILKDGLKPMKRMEIVKKNLQLLNKISETQDKMNELEKTHTINN
jgi:hypothetical protein